MKAWSNNFQIPLSETRVSQTSMYGKQNMINVPKAGIEMGFNDIGIAYIPSDN